MQIRHSIYRASSEAVVVCSLMCASVALQLLLREYGYHRDEMYYVAIGDGWSFSNLDMLPLAPLYLRLFTFLFGHSITVIHLASSICCACTLGVACLMTKELGGKLYAIALTGTFMLFSGFVIFGSIFTYDSPGILIWVAALYGALRALKENNPRWWLLVGILVGTGMLNKVTVVFLPLALVVSMLLVPQRSFFKSKWFWIAGGVVIPFMIPFLAWQFRNNWYFLSFAAQYTNEMSYRAPFLAFLWNQILPDNILTLPVWFAGLFLLLFSPQWKTYRLFGLCYLLLFLTFYILHTPFYFLMPLYAVLISVGSVWVERHLDLLGARRSFVKIIRVAIPLVYLVGSLPTLPLALPVLPVERLVAYAAALGVNAGIKTNSVVEGLLPSHFADRFGWDELVKDISDVYHSIPSGENVGPGIITGNWGEASAVHLYRLKYNLPEPISTDGWFYFQTLQTRSFASAYVAFGVPLDRLKELFSTVEQKGMFTNPYCLPHESNQRIYFCSDPTCDLGKRWLVEKQMDPHFRRYMDTAGVLRAIDYFRELKKSDPATLLFTERQLNTLGYEYLNEGKIDDAIALFKLNVEEHPQSSNVYDSLGEGYLLKKEYKLAREYYKETLRRDPTNTNAQQYLKKLETPPSY